MKSEKNINKKTFKRSQTMGKKTEKKNKDIEIDIDNDPFFNNEYDDFFKDDEDDSNEENNTKNCETISYSKKSVSSIKIVKYFRFLIFKN